MLQVGIKYFIRHLICDVISKGEFPLGSPRHDTTRTTCHACRTRRDERVVPCLFQDGRRRRSTSARVYKCSLLCSGFASSCVS